MAKTKRLTHIHLANSTVDIEDILTDQYNRANRLTCSTVNTASDGSPIYIYYVEVENLPGGNQYTVYSNEAQKVLNVPQVIETRPNVGKQIEDVLKGMKSSDYLAEPGIKFAYGKIPTEYVGTPTGITMLNDNAIYADMSQAIKWYEKIYVNSIDMKVDCKGLTINEVYHALHIKRNLNKEKLGILNYDLAGKLYINGNWTFENYESNGFHFSYKVVDNKQIPITTLVPIDITVPDEYSNYYYKLDITKTSTTIETFEGIASTDKISLEASTDGTYNIVVQFRDTDNKVVYQETAYLGFSGYVGLGRYTLGGAVVGMANDMVTMESENTIVDYLGGGAFLAPKDGIYGGNAYSNNINTINGNIKEYE